MSPNYDAIQVKANAKSIRKKTLKIRLITFVSALIILFMAMLFASIKLAKSFGMFTVGIDTDSIKAISISTKLDGSDKTSSLMGEGVNEMFNITYGDLPSDIDDVSYEGSHNGENYIAYSFYLMNIGNADVNVIESLEITNMYLNVSDAMRVRIYQDGVYTDYAKVNLDGTMDSYCEPFTTDDVVHSEILMGLQPEEKIHFTIVIWLEGTDPECVDSIRGGSICLNLNFLLNRVQDS